MPFVPHSRPARRTQALGRSHQTSAYRRRNCPNQNPFEAAITPDAAKYLADALRRNEPWLEWSSKREKPWFEVEPVALHASTSKSVSTQAIYARYRAAGRAAQISLPTRSSPTPRPSNFTNTTWIGLQPPDFLGDSLQVMASLARREDLAGKVQMIYFDPPYGISFRSNFQPNLGNVQPEDKVQDLTREPETVKAYRDTWTLGVHSYLAYLRDRLAMSRGHARGYRFNLLSRSAMKIYIAFVPS